MAEDARPEIGAQEPADEAASSHAVEEVTAELTAEQAEEYKPGAHELVVTDLGDEQQVFVVLDRHDEQQIIEEFQRRALRVMLYDIPAKGGSGKRAIDLSYAGVNEAVRLMNATGKCRIHIDRDVLHLAEVTEDLGKGPERFVVATVYAVDDVTGYGQFGTSTEPTHMRLRDGTTKWDVFARTKAINKAQRNALRTTVPERMRQTLIAQYRGDDVALRQIKAGAGAEALAGLPAPLTDERAEVQKARARELYDAIKEYAPGGVAVKLLPAYFHAQMSRAEHSHDRMDDFIAYLEQRLAEAQALLRKGGA